jgi:hypothetical protein
MPESHQTIGDLRSPGLEAPRNEKTNNERGRERDEAVLNFLDVHPADAALLVLLGFFHTINKALKRLRILEKRGKVKMVGAAFKHDGHKRRHIWSGRPISKLQHEYDLTLILLKMNIERVIRGFAVDERNADAHGWINGVMFYLELDPGTERKWTELRERFAAYEDTEHDVLWICSTPTRMNQMIKNSDNSHFWFTTFPQCLESPHQSIWLNKAGDLIALPWVKLSTQK